MLKRINRTNTFSSIRYTKSKDGTLITEKEKNTSKMQQNQH